MQTVRSLDPSIPIKDRLSTRLALLFVGTFLAVFIVLIAWTMFGTISDRQKATSQSQVAAPVIVIDPKIQTDLAKALAFDALPASTEVLNPFVDRAGIGGNFVASNTPASNQAASSTGSGGSGASSTGGGGGGTGQGAFLQPGASSMAAEVYDVKARYDEWLERQKRGEFVGPESEVLAVDDLVPVGFASGGDRGEEVILFSYALCRSFSFPAGTRFYNGSLYGFDQSEVVFTFQNGIRRKSYATTEPCQSNTNSRLANTTGEP